MRKYKVELSDEEQKELRKFCKKGTHNARTIMRAQVLLASHNGQSRSEISQLIGVHPWTVTDISKRYILQGLERALYDAPRPGQKRVLDAKDEARLIAIACSEPPDGYECWSIKLLTKEVNRCTGKDASNSTVGRILMASNLKPWQQKNVVCANDHA